MEQMTKIKVVMVCHLSNPRVRAHLPLFRSGRLGVLRGFFKKLGVKDDYYDFAIWNSNLADFFSTKDNVDYTIIAPHAGLKSTRVKYTEDGVNYVFLNYHWSNLIKRLAKLLKLENKLNPFAKVVKKEIERVQPDIVVLMGLENSYYSSSVLGITKYPVYGLCQTVYNNPSRKNYETIVPYLAVNEMRLFNELRYIGVACKMHYDLVKQYSPYAKIFKFGFLNKGKRLIPIDTKKEFDFVCFATSMSSSKGFPDAIKALSIVKKHNSNVKLDLIGQCGDEERDTLCCLINELGLNSNVMLTPFFEKQSDLFLHVQKSRFAVLPCKLDYISGTMLQSMQLGLPVVVYRTAGTPLFNREKPCALIAEMENVEDLANHMISLMKDPVLAETLKTNALEWQNKRIEAENQYGERLIDNFQAIIENFRNGTPIPKEQLFNPEIDD